MVTIDSREGSAQLWGMLRRIGIPAELGRLPFGDVAFMGIGPEGVPVPVGIEVKNIRDVLKCITDGRFAGHQLPGLINSYQQIWLLVEGQWRQNSKTGLLENLTNKGWWCEATVGQRAFMYRDLLSWLFTIQTKGGIQVAYVSSYTEATTWISSLYNWWNKGGIGYDSHHSHLAINVSGDIRNNAGWRDRAILVRPTLLRRIAAELPGIGFDKSANVAAHFASVEELFCASERELAKIPGIGKELSQRIWGALHNGK